MKKREPTMPVVVRVRRGMLVRLRAEAQRSRCTVTQLLDEAAAMLLEARTHHCARCGQRLDHQLDILAPSGGTPE
jgi:hypothetical protein